MDKATIEITKDEAELIPLLYKVTITTNLESAGQVMKNRLMLDALLDKVRKAFEEKKEE